MDPNQNQTTCTNCQAITTNDGQTVWVCENCGTQNVPAVVNPVTKIPVTEPVVPVQVPPTEPNVVIEPSVEPIEPTQTVQQTQVVEPPVEPVQPVQPIQPTV